MNPRNRLIALAAATLVSGVSTYEGFAPKDYLDRIPSRPTPTACYGHTAGAKVGTVRTKDECLGMLRQDLTYVYGPAVLDMVKVPITQGQYNALTDFGYNLGLANLRNSTLLRKVNAGDNAGAALEFAKWHNAGGKDCRVRRNGCYGIVERREWERQQYASSAASGG